MQIDRYVDILHRQIDRQSVNIYDYIGHQIRFYIYIYVIHDEYTSAFNTFPNFFRYEFKIVWTLKTSVCCCYTTYDMTDQ